MPASSQAVNALKIINEANAIINTDRNIYTKVIKNKKITPSLTGSDKSITHSQEIVNGLRNSLKRNMNASTAAEAKRAAEA